MDGGIDLRTAGSLAWRFSVKSKNRSEPTISANYRSAKQSSSPHTIHSSNWSSEFG
jgi:hypothetical protein